MVDQELGRVSAAPRVGKSASPSLAQTAAGAVKFGRTSRSATWLWSTFLFVILGGLVIYPMVMLVIGAFTIVERNDARVEVSRFSLGNFVDTLTNPKVGEAVFNSVIVCGGATVLSVMLGLVFSWIVVRTNTPARRFIGEASKIPLFIPPLVASVAWSILGSPETGLLNILLHKVGIPLTINLYSRYGLIAVFAMYYSPYVYMFASSALANMDPSLEEAAEIAGSGALRTQLTVTFPLIAPAILSSMLLSFVIMLGIYGVPAVLGTPANIPMLPTYLYSLTVWNPPQYNAAAAVSIIMIVVTAVLVFLQQKVLSSRSFVTISGKGFRPRTLDLGAWRWFTLGLAIVYIIVVVVLPFVALIITAFRNFMFIPTFASLIDMRQYSFAHFNSIFQNPQTLRSIVNTVEVGVITAGLGCIVAFAIGYTVQRSAAPGRRLIDMVATSPAAVPGMIVGVAYLWAWIGLPGGLYGTVWILALAFIGRHIPDAVRVLSTSLTQVHRELEEAAWISGSGVLKTVRTIVLPLCKPGVLAMITLLFVLSVRELGTSIFLYTADTIVMAVVLLGLNDSGTIGTTAAFGLIQIAFLIVVLGTMNVVTRAMTRTGDRPV